MKCIFILGWFICCRIGAKQFRESGVKLNSETSAKRIWIIRHCDKGRDKTPCCSDVGYTRAQLWGDYFIRKITSTPSSNITIISSGYSPISSVSDKRECPMAKPKWAETEWTETKSDHTQNCQASQRMYLTAKIIGEKLDLLFGKSKPQIQVCHSLCVGQESELVAQANNETTKNVLIVWEHKGIVDILRHFGMKVGKWKKKWKHIYSLVFWVDILTETNNPVKNDAPHWGYECVELEVGECDKILDEVREWLGKPGEGNSLQPTFDATECTQFLVAIVIIFMALGFILCFFTLSDASVRQKLRQRLGQRFLVQPHRFIRKQGVDEERRRLFTEMATYT